MGDRQLGEDILQDAFKRGLSTNMPACACFGRAAVPEDTRYRVVRDVRRARLRELHLPEALLTSARSVHDSNADAFTAHKRLVRVSRMTTASTPSTPSTQTTSALVTTVI